MQDWMGGGGGVEAGMDGCGNNSNITIVSSKGVSIGAGGVEAEVLQDLWRGRGRLTLSSAQ